MPKQREHWVCRECGGDHPKWQGQCASCGEWNTLEQVRGAAAAALSDGGARGTAGWAGGASQVTALSDVKLVAAPRIGSGFSELDRVLGGGLVPGSVLLIGGSPGQASRPCCYRSPVVSRRRPASCTSPARNRCSRSHFVLNAWNCRGMRSGSPRKRA